MIKKNVTENLFPQRAMHLLKRKFTQRLKKKKKKNLIKKDWFSRSVQKGQVIIHLSHVRAADILPFISFRRYSPHDPIQAALTVRIAQDMAPDTAPAKAGETARPEHTRQKIGSAHVIVYSRCPN